ncbi:PREDICTED: uncharacterized protein LOC109240008 [Nicotiana attenuata]|uniref:uncharacterized protein LOC109240008 n=1 Tax=Nicotiana attenuata TaxID=49451 RepID=UPI00090468D1|nr:PREDICTED: uncharacterized protein LOC109240008 [Nicotiana attenuata]
MRSQWSLPPHFNPIQSQQVPADLPFFPPGEINNMNPTFIPWPTPFDPVIPQNNQQQPQVPPPPHAHPPAAQPPPQCTRTRKCGNEGGGRSKPNGVRSSPRIFKAQRGKSLPISRSKEEKDPTVGNHAMILVPSLRRNPIPPAHKENGTPPNLPNMYRPTNVIIWNIRGGNNENFRVNFREMLDTHKPCMVTLLEARMDSHLSLLSDFEFSQMIEVPSQGQSGGILLLWDASVVKVHDFVRNNQEIHAVIEVLPLKITWLFSSVYASTKLFKRLEMWNNIEKISKTVNGPWLLWGDFNDVINYNDKLGGNPINSRRSKQVWKSINFCKLLDLGY